MVDEVDESDKNHLQYFWLLNLSRPCQKKREQSLEETKYLLFLGLSLATFPPFSLADFGAGQWT